MLALARGKEGRFKLVSGYQPQGDQPAAIESIVRNVGDGIDHQVLLGVTGSGKTFTMANVVASVNRPTLVIAPNKTLAAQLYNEFKSLFPENAVRYFVSYYDYYQPEAYVPSTDTYIEKDSSINDEIDKLRHSATKALLERNDVLIVASVSCIYGLGEPEVYFEMLAFLEEGQTIERDRVLRKLVDIQYQRNDYDFHRGTFRVRGDIVEVFPAYEESRAVRVEFFGDQVEALYEIDPLRGKVIRKLQSVCIYPASHYVTTEDRMEEAVRNIRTELRERLEYFRSENRLLEAQRLEQRTMYDLELLAEMGFCPGIENYSRHLTGRAPGQPPPTLLDYFPRDFLMFVDESHVTVPQLGGMYRGDPRASRPWSSSASACPRRSTTARSTLRNGKGWRARWLTSRPRRATTSCAARAAWWSNSSSGPPGLSILKSRCARPAPRLTICSAKFISASRPARACWSLA
jgi:excinuclease ABC subunit B